MTLARTTSFAIGAAVLALGLTADRANATPVTPSDIGALFFVDYNLADTLTARFTWTLDAVVDDVWSFTVDINNTSSNSPDANRITSFAFGTAPAASGITLTDDDNGLWNDAFASSVGGAEYQFFDLNACVHAGPNCTGGGGGGVAGQGTSTLSFDLTADTDTLIFGDFATRWQSININGMDSTVLGGTVAPIPLPAAGWMMLAGLIGLGVVARRRSKAETA